MRTVSIEAILQGLKDFTFHGNRSHQIEYPLELSSATTNLGRAGMTWVSDKNLSSVVGSSLTAGLLVLSPQGFEKLKGTDCNFLVVDNPRLIFFQIVKSFFTIHREPRIEATAQIHPNAILGEGCYIGHHVVIEEGCRIGNYTTILHNTVVLANSIIGNHVIIGSNNTIGNYGFGYEKGESGSYELLQHVGNVVIHDNVEIHNNTCIDRAVMGSTILHRNVKIDNLVHIAHGAVIGANSLVIANAVVAGSVRIGENSWIAPSVTIRNKATIADNTMTGIGAVILKDTISNETYIGNPATTLDEYKRWSEIRKKLLE